MTDLKKDLWIHFMSSRAVNKLMKALKKMDQQQILCVCIAPGLPVMRNQRESLAHFVSGIAFLPARNERTVRQQHHRPSSGVPPPSVFHRAGK